MSRAKEKRLGIILNYTLNYNCVIYTISCIINLRDEFQGQQLFAIQLYVNCRSFVNSRETRRRSLRTSNLIRRVQAVSYKQNESHRFFEGGGNIAK